MRDNSRTDSQRAQAVAVRCLSCGATYEKPTGVGTMRANPGCPKCAYVGWIGAGEDVSEAGGRRRFGADRRPLRYDRSR